MGIAKHVLQQLNKTMA